MLFRCLLLAEWNGLSDRALEEALEFRIDFKKFAGLEVYAAVPDATPRSPNTSRSEDLRGGKPDVFRGDDRTGLLSHTARRGGGPAREGTQRRAFCCAGARHQKRRRAEARTENSTPPHCVRHWQTRPTAF